jgi:hypothetical protein
MNLTPNLKTKVGELFQNYVQTGRRIAPFILSFTVIVFLRGTIGLLKLNHSTLIHTWCSKGYRSVFLQLLSTAQRRLLTGKISVEGA